MSDAAKVAHFKKALEKAKTNLSPEVLDKLAYISAWHARETSFGDAVMSKLTVTECSTFVRPEDGKRHGRIVYEGSVTEGESLLLPHCAGLHMLTSDMCNSHGMMHGGCAAFMVDWSVGCFEGVRVKNIAKALITFSCTSMALVIMGLVTGSPVDLVSQSLSTTYHAGAKL